ncbi:MAG: hypothetical protein ACOX00_01590 [Peptoniphilaceae bacterium]|jgi:hypothetical protein|nr:hypothetical protein [Bacillota bacterium]
MYPTNLAYYEDLIIEPEAMCRGGTIDLYGEHMAHPCSRSPVS